jgi:hypothetical protein
VAAHTLEQLQDRIDASISWRRIELSALGNEISRPSRATASPLARALARSGTALLYAHWEGFTKESVQAYLDYVAKRRLKMAQLNDGLLQTVFASLHKRMASGDPQAVRLLCDAIRRPELARAPVPRQGIVNDILQSVGLQHEPFKTKKHLIDTSLCDARNEIAHGRERFPSPREFEDLHESVMIMMEALREAIMAAAREEEYKVSPVGP